ncbi:MAG: ubiquitin, partial [Peptostreptococcaceae bacterium]|nr:ubiquitin [Peptostreptococcaceae bacterium]
DDGSEVDVNEETQKRILLLKGKVEEKKSDFDDEDVIDITNISTKTQTDNKEE